MEGASFQSGGWVRSGCFRVKGASEWVRNFRVEGVRYSLPVIGPCNYRPVITAVITVITALCFPITCNWSFAERFRASPPCVLTPDDVKEAVAKKMKSKRTKQYT